MDNDLPERFFFLLLQIEALPGRLTHSREGQIFEKRTRHVNFSPKRIDFTTYSYRFFYIYII